MENRKEPGVGGFSDPPVAAHWPPRLRADGRPLFFARGGQVFDMSGVGMSPEACAHERDCAAAGVASADRLGRPAVAHAWRLYGALLSEAVATAAAQRREDADWSRSIVRGVLHPPRVGRLTALARLLGLRP